MNPKERFIMKAYQLSYKLRKALGYKWYKNTKQEHQIYFDDIAYFTEELIEYLLIEEINTLEDYIQSIDSWLDLESKTFNYFYPLKYKVGEFFLTLEKINLHRDFIDLKEKLNIVN
jgi:hypothetical protein